MSDLPGFTKLTSTPTKFRDLEMEDTFLQNLQVMNGGSKDFEMENSSLSFNSSEMNLFVGASPEKGYDIPTIYYSAEGIESAYNYDGFYLIISDEENNQKGTGVCVNPVSLSLQKYTNNAGVEEYFEIATTDQIIEPEGITKASDMNQATFWDADVVVPTGYTLTNTDGIPGEQITSGYISASRINNLSAGKITSGTFNVDRIPDLNANKITAGTLNEDRIPDLSSTYAKLTNNKISENAIPDLSSTYASLTNSKISTSVIPNLGSSAGITIDASLITNTPWVSTVGDMVGDFWGEGIQTLYIPEYITVSTSNIRLRHVLNPSTAIELLVSIPNDIHSLFIKSSDGSSAGFDLQGVQVINQYHKAITHASDMNNSTFWNSNVDMGDKNLTTTGTVTASNIPSST